MTENPETQNSALKMSETQTEAPPDTQLLIEDLEKNSFMGTCLVKTKPTKDGSVMTFCDKDKEKFTITVVNRDIVDEVFKNIARKKCYIFYNLKDDKKNSFIITKNTEYKEIPELTNHKNTAGMREITVECATKEYRKTKSGWVILKIIFIDKNEDYISATIFHGEDSTGENLVEKFNNPIEEDKNYSIKGFKTKIDSKDKLNSSHCVLVFNENTQVQELQDP